MTIEHKKQNFVAQFDAMSDLAVDIVEAMARAHMDKFPEIQSFVNGMGCWTYWLKEDITHTDEDGEVWDIGNESIGAIDPSTYNGTPKYNDEDMTDFMATYGDSLKITGDAFRLDRDRVSGEIIKATDW